MPLEHSVAPVIVLHPDPGESARVATWLRTAGLGAISTARTCDEAIFMLGSRSATLLIIDEQVTERSERRLLQHIAGSGHAIAPALVRLGGQASAAWPGAGRALATEIIQKPLLDHDVVARVGSAIQRPDLITQFRRAREMSRDHLEAAQQMQVRLLPTADQLHGLEQQCGVGLAALYDAGEAVGGDFWSIWPLGGQCFALAVVDFAGHGLSAALNTFRIHALLSEHTLPRDQPGQMTAILNERLHALLPRGQYATMIYLVVDPAKHRIVWCSAGGPNPMVVAAGGEIELAATGLSLGVKAGAIYQTHSAQLPGAGILCVFSDGLFESGPDMPDVPRDAIAAALAASFDLAASWAAGRGRPGCRATARSGAQSLSERRLLR
jgi:sigma-B regulation protein RsbU (phosphoserine phosphatase)